MCPLRTDPRPVFRRPQVILKVSGVCGMYYRHPIFYRQRPSPPLPPLEDGEGQHDGNGVADGPVDAHAVVARNGTHHGSGSPKKHANGQQQRSPAKPPAKNGGGGGKARAQLVNGVLKANGIKAA